MVVRKPRYSKEEFARRGDEIYARAIRSLMETNESKVKFVAIDILDTSLMTHLPNKHESTGFSGQKSI